MSGLFGPRGELTTAHFPFLGFVERAQAFSLGAIAMIEASNPLAAATLLRSLAENLASVFYLSSHPKDFDKFQPGANHGVRVGRFIAAAESSLPGFKRMYGELSNMAHPSGAGSFHTMQVSDTGQFTWQSSPKFKSASDAEHLLGLLSELNDLTTDVIRQTVRRFEERSPVAGSGEV